MVTKKSFPRIRKALSLMAICSLTLSGCSLITLDNNATSTRKLTASGSFTSPGSSSSAGTTVQSRTSLQGPTGPLTSHPATTSPALTGPSTTSPMTTGGSRSEERIKGILEGLTLEAKVRQMLLVHGSATISTRTAADYAGYIFFADFFRDRTPDEVRTLLEKINSRTNVPFPMLFAVDEEGGTVNRISGFSQYRETKFPSPRKIYQQAGLSGLVLDTRDKAMFLKGLGINFNLAPVADVSSDPESFIYPRTLGLSTDETASAIRAMILTMTEENILSSLKHFPGYGDNVDTHQAIAVDDSTMPDLEQRLKPFQAGIDAGADTLMVSHIIIRAFDENVPASLSGKAHAYIRQVMGFNGVILTDDLQMKGLTQITDDPFAAAVLAGNDLLITDEPDQAVQSIIKAVEDQVISEGQIEASVLRVLTLKASLVP